MNNTNPFSNPYLLQNPRNPMMSMPSPVINFEDKYKEQLKTLEEMGFTNKTTNLEALKATNGNIEAAIERMMNLGN